MKSLHRAIGISALLFGIPLALHALGVTRLVEKIADRAAKVVLPARGVVFSLSSAVGGDPRREELSKLREEVERLVVENAKLRAAADENRVLRELLNFSERTRASLITAAVVGHSSDPERRAIFIDRGTRDGVIAGAPVISGEGILVGRVIAASPSRATVLIITDRRSRFGAMVNQNPAAVGVLEGGYGTGVRLVLIPKQASIAEGDRVVTAGLEEQFVPRDLVIGRIESVHDEPNSAFRAAVISPQADLDRLTVVGVLVQRGEGP